MAFSIKNPRTDELARELAKETGESLTEAVTRAIEERLAKVQTQSSRRKLVQDLNAIARACAALPDRDMRSADEIIGYDENGLPT